MKYLFLAAAMALGLAAGAPASARIHGIIIHRCHPTRYNRWCHRHPIGIIIGHPIGRVVGHGPVGVKTIPNHGFPNGIQPEQRVQH
jgi:hypothetical protein